MSPMHETVPSQALRDMYLVLHGHCCDLRWGMCAQVLSQRMPMEMEPQGRDIYTQACMANAVI